MSYRQIQGRVAGRMHWLTVHESELPRAAEQIARTWSLCSGSAIPPSVVVELRFEGLTQPTVWEIEVALDVSVSAKSGRIVMLEDEVTP